MNHYNTSTGIIYKGTLPSGRLSVNSVFIPMVVAKIMPWEEIEGIAVTVYEGGDAYGLSRHWHQVYNGVIWNEQ